MSNYVAIIPIVSVMLTATAAMLAEAFRQPGERMPLFGLGLIGLVGAAISSIMLWDTDARSFGVVRADNFTLFINLILCVVGVLTMLFSTEVVEREGLPPGEFYALTLFGLSGCRVGWPMTFGGCGLVGGWRLGGLGGGVMLILLGRLSCCGISTVKG